MFNWLRPAFFGPLSLHSYGYVPKIRGHNTDFDDTRIAGLLSKLCDH